MKGNALILLNRYFDVYDEIKDPDNHLEEEPELKDTEFGFLQTFKSQENIINESQREEIHQWIINTGVEKNISKILMFTFRTYFFIQSFRYIFFI